MGPEPFILGVVASPSAGGRTATAVETVLSGTGQARTSLLNTEETSTADVIKAMDEADAVVFGSPVYRAGCSSMLRQLLESTQRGMYGEEQAPLSGKAAAVVMTGATPHHYLAGDELRAILSGFFAVQVLAPNLYFEHASFESRGALAAGARETAENAGRALADLTLCVRNSTSLRALAPQV
ncbi:flavodoxin family protein [Arthrobacter pigmenti]